MDGIPTIYAVIWVDFGIMLSLPASSDIDAKRKAQAMDARAKASGVELRGLQAVSLWRDDKLRTLWEPTE